MNKRQPKFPTSRTIIPNLDTRRNSIVTGLSYGLEFDFGESYLSRRVCQWSLARRRAPLYSNMDPTTVFYFFPSAAAFTDPLEYFMHNEFPSGGASN